ncbi:MAG: hypothetical protein KME27_10230 [Lyngbya sp. HA4199-MV5]|jgi:hypothetical protein|nr:hypothetical protein [Lyngbya sp. HA4199-MV5]
MIGFLMRYRILEAKLVGLEQSKAELQAANVYGKRLKKVEREIAIVRSKMTVLLADAQRSERHTDSRRAIDTDATTNRHRRTDRPGLLSR